MFRRTALSVHSRLPTCSPRLNFHLATLLNKRKVIQQFRLADIGEGITECEVIKWKVKPHNVVQSFDPLCEVQSDKASVEITSPFDGTVTELLVKEGEVAKVGEGLCLIEVEEDTEESGESTTSSISKPPGTMDISTADTSNDAMDTSWKQQRTPHPLDPSYQVEKRYARDILATPSVRHFARQNGIDLSVIGKGSGKGGRIEKKDIEAFISRDTEEITTPSIIETGEQNIELGRTRFAMWKAMTKSLEIPHFGYSVTLDLTKLSALLPILNNYIPRIYLPSEAEAEASQQAVSPYSIFSKPPSLQGDPLMHFKRVTLLPLLLKTLSRAMLEWPLFRSSVAFVPDAMSKRKPALTIRPHSDISIALSTPTGLYTPTITSVDTLSSYEIMGRLRRLQHLGRQVPCALGPLEMPKRGGTLTVSNVGAIGRGEFASPVLVPGGGVAIVAIGKAKWVDVVPESGIGISTRKLQVGISWSADHRVIEGAELAAFVETWRTWVENPERLVGNAV